MPGQTLGLLSKDALAIAGGRLGRVQPCCAYLSAALVAMVPNSFRSGTAIVSRIATSRSLITTKGSPVFSRSRLCTGSGLTSWPLDDMREATSTSDPVSETGGSEVRRGAHQRLS